LFKGSAAASSRSAGLTDPPDADQGDQPFPRPEQRPNLVQLSFPANEGGQGHRNVAGDLYVLRAVGQRIRFGILCLPHVGHHGTRGITGIW
jgi:hypothetical protein